MIRQCRYCSKRETVSPYRSSLLIVGSCNVCVSRHTKRQKEVIHRKTKLVLMTKTKIRKVS